MKITLRHLALFSGLGIMLAVIIGIVTMTAKSPTALSGQVRVAASFYPLYEFAKQVGGDRVVVQNVTPSSVEPHDFEPSPRALADVTQANLFIYNGGLLEPWVTNFLADYHGTTLAASKGLTLNAGDPHFWLDPIDAQQVITNIRDALIAVDPAGTAEYESRAAAYQSKLADLDAAFSTGLTHCETHTIITAHQAFGYLGKRYKLEIASISGLNPEQEPSAATMARLTQLVAEKHLHYVFTEQLVSPKLAQTIAHETGAQTLTFDPIEGISDADQQKGHDYISIQHDNLDALRTALTCK